MQATTNTMYFSYFRDLCFILQIDTRNFEMILFTCWVFNQEVSDVESRKVIAFPTV